MSLWRPITRVCAVAALRQRTWAGDRVFDSDKTPLAQAVGQKPQPYISVYTDDDTRSEIEGLQVYMANRRRVALIFEIGVASAVSGPADQNGDPTVIVQFAATDQATEWAVDAVETQLLAALIGDPHSEWGELFKQLVGSVAVMPSKRGGKAEGGVRWAARQLIMVCEPTIFDLAPNVTVDLNHPFRKFATMAAADPTLGVVDIAAVVNSLLAAPVNPDWQQAQGWLGVTKEGLAVRGVGPLIGFGESDEVEPVMTQWTAQGPAGEQPMNTTTPDLPNNGNNPG